MDLQTLINLGVAVVIPFVGWLAKSHIDLKVEMARDYVRHEQLGEIKALLEKIRDALNNKADK